MEKKTYYVAVGSGDILEDKSDSPYEFEIEATQEEIDQLQELFNDRHQADWYTWIGAHIPIVPYHQLDKDNDQYDDNLYAIYKMLYELGSPETKSEIEKLGILH